MGKLALSALYAIPGVGPVVGVLGSVVSFILSCKPCMFALAGLALWVWGDIHGARKERAACKAADIAMQLKAKERDEAIQKDTIKFQQSQLSTLKEQVHSLEEEKKAYEELPHIACPLGVDRAGRLRNILNR